MGRLRKAGGGREVRVGALRRNAAGVVGFMVCDRCRISLSPQPASFSSSGSPTWTCWAAACCAAAAAAAGGAPAPSAAAPTPPAGWNLRVGNRARAAAAARSSGRVEKEARESSPPAAPRCSSARAWVASCLSAMVTAIVPPLAAGAAERPAVLRRAGLGRSGAHCDGFSRLN